MSIYCKYLYFNKKRFIMSAGICIMNKKAVAMAADSAVTIGNHEAIHNSANKLFSLSYFAPIGLIIYANPEFMSVPMDIIIKQYRKILGKQTFPSLNDYLADFISYIESNIKFYQFDEKLYVYNIFNSVLEIYNNFVLANDDSDKAYNSTILKLDNFKKNQDDSASKYVEEKYAKDFIQTLEADPNLRLLSKDKITNLCNSICNLFDTDYEVNDYLGFAIAGYGENDLYPKLVHIHISGLLNSKIKYRIVENPTIDNNNQSSITPLAQRDVIDTFVFGINHKYIMELAKDIPDQFNDYIKSIDDNLFVPGKKDEVLKKLQADGSNIILERIVKILVDSFMIPMISSVRSLPIEELALLAESMINITSLRRKVIIDPNIGTVGGPIDVAVISKGEGFIWLKRKHYFEKQLNPQYFYTRFTNFDNCIRNQSEEINNNRTN